MVLNILYYFNAQVSSEERSFLKIRIFTKASSYVGIMNKIMIRVYNIFRATKNSIILIYMYFIQA